VISSTFNINLQSHKMWWQWFITAWKGRCKLKALSNSKCFHETFWQGRYRGVFGFHITDDLVDQSESRVAISNW